MARPSLSYLKNLMLGLATLIVTLVRNPVRGFSGLAAGAWSGLKGRRLTSVVLVLILRNLVLTLLGLAVGAWSGFTGMSAGPLLTPLSLWLLGLKERRLGALVISITLISAIFAISVLERRHNLPLLDAVSFALISIIGATMGGSPVMASLRDTRRADMVWSCLTLLLGAWLIYESPAIVRSQTAAHSLTMLATAGFLAGFVGRAANLGGALAVPALLLLYGDAPMVAQVTSLIVLTIVSAPPALAYAVKRDTPGSMVTWVGVGAAMGALLGADAAFHSRPAVLVEVYGVGLFCLGFYRCFFAWSIRASQPQPGAP